MDQRYLTPNEREQILEARRHVEAYRLLLDDCFARNARTEYEQLHPQYEAAQQALRTLLADVTTRLLAE